MSRPLKRYLGDSVYAEKRGEDILLTTENGDGPTNEIYLEPHVWDALYLFHSELFTK